MKSAYDLISRMFPADNFRAHAKEVELAAQFHACILMQASQRFDEHRIWTSEEIRAELIRWASIAHIGQARVYPDKI